MKITINSKKIIDANPGRTIFDSAISNGITIDHSCLNGRCSACKVKVITGDFYMPSNQEGLTKEDVRNQYCLTCISTPKSDLILEEVKYTEGILPEVRILPAKISKLEFPSKEVAKLTLRTPPNNKLKFLAGQYVDISVKNIKRSYSIASKPSESNLEFIIKKYPNGQFSDYLFHEAKINDLLRIEGPKGTYLLPKKLEKIIVFLSTGTGIAPNLSLIKFALEKELLDPSQIILIHGQRHREEHIYNLTETFPEMKVIQTTSKESAKGMFNGYVQDALLKEKLDLEKVQVFACGNPNMIITAKEKLIENGLLSSNFRSDIFVKSD